MDATALNVLVMVATAATAIFTGLAVWQRWRYTPRPLWLPPKLQQTQNPYQEGDTGSVRYGIPNRGDAMATDVRIAVSSAKRWERKRWDELETIPVVEFGDDAQFWMSSPASYPGSYRPKGDRWEHPLVWDWKPTRVRVQWREHPSLRRVRSKAFDLPRPKDEPGVSSPDAVPKSTTA